VLGKDLEQENVRVSDVIRSIQYAIYSIEVLDSRIIEWNIEPADSIADNGSGGAHVLGTSPRKITDCDLSSSPNVLAISMALIGAAR
jgi:2-keto-4-pentenoate hydratase